MTPRQLLRTLLGGVFYGALVFGPAGSLRWIEGWAFLAILLGAAVAGIRSLRRADTGLLEERGQRVIESGPYGVVRHPMYSAMLLLFPGGSLLLGSLLSLAIALLICLLTIVRVPLEESLLRRGLPGYDKYRERVRFRLIPHVW